MMEAMGKSWRHGRVAFEGVTDRGARAARGLFRMAFGVVLAVVTMVTMPLLGSGQQLAVGNDPRAFVESLGGAVLEILRTPDIDAAKRQQRFRTLFSEAFDAPTIGRFVLGPYWSRANEAQRKDYIDLFSNYVAAIYATQFSRYEGETFKTERTDVVDHGDGVVWSEIDKPGRAPIKVGFRVRSGSDGLKIVDVTVAGVSLIVTKREEFASVLGREGLDGIMRRMRETLKRTEAARPAAVA